MRHRAALFSTILALTTAVTAVGAPASAAVPGFDVKITELPDTFSPGAAPRTMTVVVSTDVGRRCQKVRWSMLMRVDGVDLDQVRVDRVEDTGSFPLQVQTDGDTARLTDVQLDPGELCTGSTVTARYRVAFAADADEGQVTFEATALTSKGRVLQQAVAQSQVLSGATVEPTPIEVSPDPSPSPSAAESADPEESAVDDEVSADGTAEVTPSRKGGAIASVPAADGGTPSLLGPGLIIGAVLVFLGVGLLLRLRLKMRRGTGPALPPTFYPTH